MEKETQSFRLSGTADSVHVPVRHQQGLKVVVWDDIEQFFPKLAQVKKGNAPVAFKRDSNNIKLSPLCIGYFPDDVLDVIETQDDPDESSNGASKDTRQVSQEDGRPVGVGSSAALNLDRVAGTTQRASLPKTRPVPQPRSLTQMRDPFSSIRAKLPNVAQKEGQQGAVLPIKVMIGKAPSEIIESPIGTGPQSAPDEDTTAELASTMENLTVGSAPDISGNQNSRSLEKLGPLLQEAEGGDAQAQYLLAEKYDRGELADNGDVESQHLALAFQWYQKAALQGHVQAQRCLGNSYKHARGVPEDYSKAQEWFKKAGDQGDVEALIALAFIKKNGQGGAKNVGKFFELTGKALAPLLFEGRRFP
ncbi:uncharacterized protein EMPS_01636 [Entomortierella parvispora]|uniref:Uncharacterized protein n=1 Tax=Entomortierella parvispora TaxID=205924 RepID=A0A9P3H3E3_9FUNG|nr:uncharacterized protein EMPS_01636 [Entomortierella parvispora]